MARRLSLLLVVLLAVVASVLLGSARAATCPPPPSPVKPFLAWGDLRPYVLTTGGSFEAGAPAWTLTGGAKVVAGNAPNALDPPSHASSLYLPAGSSATSPCVTAPQILGIVRFFARNAGAAGGLLRVDVLVKGGVYPAGVITAGSDWAPSPVLLSNAPGYTGAVAFQVRLTPVGSWSAFMVDDVYFDPWKVT
jgi:hypothetical protein